MGRYLMSSFSLLAFSLFLLHSLPSSHLTTFSVFSHGSRCIPHSMNVPQILVVKGTDY